MALLKSCVKLILFTLLFSACQPQTETADSTIDTDSIENNQVTDESPLYYIVSVENGYNYDSLKAIAKQTAAITYMSFDTLDRYYNPKKGVVLHENDPDKEWAGKYFLRRMGSNFISIEMTNAYVDTTITDDAAIEKHQQDSTRMFVFAMMYPRKKSADSLAALIKPKFLSLIHI